MERIRAQNRIKAREIASWVERLAGTSQILPMDTSCFREWARLTEGKQDQLLEDAMIAATARIHMLVVATQNDKDFAQLDVPVENPFHVEKESARVWKSLAPRLIDRHYGEK